MRRKAWVHQVNRQIAKYGEDNASWYVSWNDPEGKLRTKSCGAGPKGKKAAEKLADKRHSELVTGTYMAEEKKTWEQFRADYDAGALAGMPRRSADAAKLALGHFQRLAKPGRVAYIDSKKIDTYVAERRKEESTRLEADGKTKRSVAVATINKELRYIRAALRTAHDYGYLPKVPRIRFLKEQEKLPTYIPPEHFTAIYKACEVAKFPQRVPNVDPCDWWRALLVTASMTGWRIGQILALRWDDIDLEAGTALSRADDNKGKRDERIPLHPLAVEHMRKLEGSFSPKVFPWLNHARMLWTQFDRIQESAKLPGDKPMPKAGKEGAWYGFHDLRRGFATLNADALDLFELQRLMQHRSLETTKRYVNMAGRLNRAVQKLHVPELLTEGIA